MRWRIACEFAVPGYGLRTRRRPQDERNCDPNDVAQCNGNPFKVRYVKDTNFVSGMKVERRVVRICHAYWRGNEVATFLESLTPLRREG